MRAGLFDHQWLFLSRPGTRQEDVARGPWRTGNPPGLWGSASRTPPVPCLVPRAGGRVWEAGAPQPNLQLRLGLRGDSQQQGPACIKSFSFHFLSDLIFQRLGPVHLRCREEPRMHACFLLTGLDGWLVDQAGSASPPAPHLFPSSLALPPPVGLRPAASPSVPFRPPKPPAYPARPHCQRPHLQVWGKCWDRNLTECDPKQGPRTRPSEA